MPYFRVVIDGFDEGQRIARVEEEHYGGKERLKFLHFYIGQRSNFNEINYAFFSAKALIIP
jgi:hypothetical protein